LQSLFWRTFADDYARALEFLAEWIVNGVKTSVGAQSLSDRLVGYRRDLIVAIGDELTICAIEPDALGELAAFACAAKNAFDQEYADDINAE
jgi:hypothetical protein